MGRKLRIYPENRTRPVLVVLTFLTQIVTVTRASSAAAASPSAAANLGKLPRCPLLFQINTRVVLDEISGQLTKRATLDDFPDTNLDDIAKIGYDFVYFLGVWQTGDYGIKKSMMVLEHDACCKGLPKEAACSSPFAVTDYSTHKDFGGDEALQRLRDRCHARGLRLMVDFVPNHMAVDHPWTKTRPELLIQGSDNSVKREPQNFFRVGDKVFAHGKDMYYDGWTDTVQLNYGNPALRMEMCEILRKMAGLADGVRCDMAMLICEDVLEKTWGGRLAPPGQPRAQGQFWPGAIRGAKEVRYHYCIVSSIILFYLPKMRSTKEVCAGAHAHTVQRNGMSVVAPVPLPSPPPALHLPPLAVPRNEGAHRTASSTTTAAAAAAAAACVRACVCVCVHRAGEPGLHLCGGVLLGPGVGAADARLRLLLRQVRRKKHHEIFLVLY